MSTTDYTKDLETLKESLNQLNKKELELSSAMQTYQQGLNREVSESETRQLQYNQVSLKM